MSYVKGYKCTVCHQTYDNKEDLLVCPKCGELGILDIEYDYEKINKVFTKEYLLENKDYSI